MAHPRKFRFAAQAPGAASAKEWRELAKRVEDQGFSALTMPDHFDDQLAPVAALTAAADATTTLKLGTMVFGQDYRHPLVLAHECATLDVLSEGRLEVGIGAGWQRTDYERSGIAYDEPKVRVDRFAETVDVLKGLWTQQPFSYQGKHWQITEHTLKPQPLQQPHPPIVIGGGGKRVLTIAAQEADIVGINANLKSGDGGSPEVAGDFNHESTMNKLGWIRAAAGERYDDLELTMLIGFGMVTDDAAGILAGVGSAFGISAEEAEHVPAVLIGTVDAMCEELQRRRELYDVSYYVFENGTWDVMTEVVGRLSGT